MVRPPRSALGPTLAVAGAVGLALFGSFLLVLTPSLGDRSGLQTLWVLFSLVLLKLPLLALVWWLIVRRRGRGSPAWSTEATTALLDRAEAEIDRAEAGDADPAALDDLRREAWAAAGGAGEREAPALVDLALRIERRRPRPRAGAASRAPLSPGAPPLERCRPGGP